LVISKEAVVRFEDIRVRQAFDALKVKAEQYCVVMKRLVHASEIQVDRTGEQKF
jgi:hypothetical protein